MRAATIDLFVTYSDDLKSLGSPVLHNIFQDINQLSKLVEEKSCFIKRIKNSFFLLVPRHDFYYDILYMSIDIKNLCDSLPVFLGEYTADYQLRASIIGHDPLAGEISEIFIKCGFTLGRKIARMRNLSDKKDIENLIALLCDDNEYNVEFATTGDEQAILNLLLSEFDARSDNLPEISEISQNVREKQVIVIRHRNEIIGLHYFTCHRSCVYGWYDVISKPYRKKHLYLYIMLFLYNFWKQQKKIMRSYSWRDVTNKRLMQLACQSNQIPDGVYIYNMLYAPKKFEAAQEGD